MVEGSGSCEHGLLH